MSTLEEKEMKVLSFLSKDNVFAFLLEYKKAQEEYNKMKKVYDKNVKEVLKEIANGEGVVVENDIFRVNISQPQEIEKMISISAARKLPQEIKDMVTKKGMTSSRMLITLIEDETEEF